ncbi:MAG: hypothetical protein ACTHMY_03430 [Solirubrobacteraceae bacterium]
MSIEAVIGIAVAVVLWAIPADRVRRAILRKRAKPQTRGMRIYVPKGRIPPSPTATRYTYYM